MKLLNPLHFDKIWGYEDWIASTHADGPQKDFISLVKDYPLLVKIIQADSTLSVQVHPDDKTALLLEGAGSRGKTECWYILDAAEDARLVYGLERDFSKEELLCAIEKDEIEGLLRQVSVKKGDFVFIPSGTVHAIGGGLRLLEVQQSCNITYRFYDWGRGRELHIEKGLKSIKSSAQIKEDPAGSASMNGRNFDLSEISPFEDEFRCKYFSIEKHSVSKSAPFEFTGHENVSLLFVLEGNGLVFSGSETQEMHKEQIYAVTSGEKVKISGEGSFLVIKAF